MGDLLNTSTGKTEPNQLDKTQAGSVTSNITNNKAVYGSTTPSGSSSGTVSQVNGGPGKRAAG